MILCDREIKQAIKNKEIIINPLPEAGAYASTALDLRLGSRFHKWKKAGGQGLVGNIDLSDPAYNIDDLAKKYAELIDLKDGETLTFNPGEFILAWTLEDVTLPADSRIAARIEGKSKFARAGIMVHLTAPTIHSGFNGELRLEMVNLSPNTVILKPGMRICQLIFEQVFGTPELGYTGGFKGQGAKKTKSGRRAR